MKLSIDKKSLSELEKKLRSMVKIIQSSPDKIIDELLKIGESEAESNILKGYDADGNTDIYVDTVVLRNAGRLSMIGDDVAYQEFGYGLIGRTSPHPVLPSGYEYGQRTEWVYRDEEYGDPARSYGRWSHGLVSRFPMYLASKAMRKALPSVVKEYVKID